MTQLMFSSEDKYFFTNEIKVQILQSQCNCLLVFNSLSSITIMFDDYLVLSPIFIQFFSPDFHLLFAPGLAVRLFQNPARPSEANLGK
jgi:hypothetical protein